MEIGPVREPPAIYKNAALITEEAEALADTGRDVIIVSYLYGSVSACRRRSSSPSLDCASGLD